MTCWEEAKGETRVLGLHRVFLKENMRTGNSDCFWIGQLDGYETGESGQGERDPVFTVHLFTNLNFSSYAGSTFSQ